MTECKCFHRRAKLHLFVGLGVMLLGGFIGIAVKDPGTHQAGLLLAVLGVVLMIISAMVIAGEQVRSREKEMHMSCSVDTFKPGFVEQLMKIEPRKPRPFYLLTATLQDGDILKRADGTLFVPIYHDGQLRGEPFETYNEVSLEAVETIQHESPIGEPGQLMGLSFETVEDQIDKKADLLFKEYMKTFPTVDRVFITAFHHPDELLIGLTVGKHPARPITSFEELDAIRTCIANVAHATVPHHHV